MPKILITDDSEDLRELFAVIMERHGFEAITASNKKDLLTKLPVIVPDLLLLDVRLGGDDGRQLCREIKTRYPGIPVILVSGSPELLSHYDECKADDVLEKPFQINTVIEKINTLIKNTAN